MPISRFLLDYERFRREVQPLVEMADRGDFDAVRKTGEEVALMLRRSEWILEGLGTTLKGDVKQYAIDDNDPFLTGYAFLILLSQYLTPLPFQVKGRGYIQRALRVLGWGERDVSAFTLGKSHTTLLKPELVSDPLERPAPDQEDPRWSDPAYYWWWLRPSHSFRIGWWDLELIKTLRTRLAEMRTDFEQLDITSLELPHEITRDTFLDAYNGVLRLYEFALAEEVGLYLVVS